VRSFKLAEVATESRIRRVFVDDCVARLTTRRCGWAPDTRKSCDNVPMCRSDLRPPTNRARFNRSGLVFNGFGLDTSGACGFRSHLRHRKADSAALYPHVPWTPAPGGLPTEQMNTRTEPNASPFWPTPIGLGGPARRRYRFSRPGE
jgi:hypothetical protein